MDLCRHSQRTEIRIETQLLYHRQVGDNSNSVSYLSAYCKLKVDLPPFIAPPVVKLIIREASA